MEQDELHEEIAGEQLTSFETEDTEEADESHDETMETEASEEEGQQEAEEQSEGAETPQLFDAKSWFGNQPPEAQALITRMYEQGQRLQAMEQAQQQQQQGRTLLDLSEEEFEQYLGQQWQAVVMPEFYRQVDVDHGAAEWYRAQQSQKFAEARQQHRQARAQRNQQVMDQHSQRVAAAINQDPAYEPIRWAQPGIIEECRREGVRPEWLAEQLRMFEEARSQRKVDRQSVQKRNRTQAYTEMVDGGAPPSKSTDKEASFRGMWKELMNS